MSDRLENKSNVPERLVFEEDEGWYEYGNIPYSIHYQFNCPDGVSFSKTDPVYTKVTPNLGGVFSLDIWVHESVPKMFIDVVMFHELTEAELIYAEKVGKQKAYKTAATRTLEYARAHLSLADFREFIKWDSSLSQEYQALKKNIKVGPNNDKSKNA